MPYPISEYRRQRRIYLERVVIYRRKGLVGAVLNCQRAFVMLRRKV